MAAATPALTDAGVVLGASWAVLHLLGLRPNANVQVRRARGKTD